MSGPGFSPANKNVRKEAALAAGVRPRQQDDLYPDAEARQSNAHSLPDMSLRKRFRSALNLLHCTMREIFDESAYARFLTRRQIATSPQAYADFLRETQAHRERRPRCC